MKKPRLSLCMIVKDEAAILPACLESVQALVDEIIVVDTGSRDETPEISRSFGAKVHFSAWNNHFSEARNESLKYATGEWILILDADEVIDQEDIPRIRKLLLARNVDAYRLIQRTYQKRSTLAEWKALETETPLARGCPGYIPSPLVRLFRNLEQVRFKGRVHELVEHDLLAQGRTIVDTDIPIHHYGKILGQERLQRKQELYRRIGEDKLRDQPVDARAFCELGVQYLELGLDDEAEEVLRQACELDPKDPKAAFNLAIVLSRQGKNQDAAQKYRTVLDLDPAHVGACNNLALILQKQKGTNNDVRGLYKKALKHNPQHHVLCYNYGLVLEKEGLFREAEEQYQQALRIDPDFEPAQNGLERALKLAQSSKLKAKSKKGEIHRMPSQDTKEKEGLTVDHGAQDDTSTGLNNDFATTGLSYLRQEKWIEALDAFAHALEQDPNNADLRYRCGYVLEMLGQKDAALEQYQEALTLEPRHPETLLRLALEAWNRGLIDDCIKLYEELLTASPDHAQAHLGLCCALERQGKWERALEHVTRALEIAPDDPIALQERERLRERVPKARLSPSVETGERRLRIAFLWGGIPFSGDTIKKKPIGGTETAMIHMARNLALLGHEVRVFVKSGRGEFDGVLYSDLEGYVEDLESRPADVVVTARFFHPFVTPISARIRIFWTEDAHDQPFVEPLARPEVVARIDRIFTVSHWQTRMLSKHFGIPEDKFYVTRNGVHWEHFQSLSEERNRKKLIYTSTPFRGLDVLLDVFPIIRERVPEAELDIYSSMAVYQIDRDQDEAQYGDLYRKAKQPGVTFKGSVIQSELARALLSAGILAYPNHFAETSCIAALEAMAAGVPIVTSHLGALPETVARGGVLIEGDARTEAYQSQFVDEVCGLLNDPAQWERLSASGRNRVFEHNRWDLIAKEWTVEFERLLREQARPSVALATRETATSVSAEQMMPVEHLPKNQEWVGPYFGQFFEYMRRSLVPGGSEFGLGMTLFSLAVSINAANVIEIGRFKGFSTLALASALKFLDLGWQEPLQHKQRPDIDYTEFENPKERKLYSIDPCPTQEAAKLIQDAGLTQYVNFIDQRSDTVKVDGLVDLILIDGDHSYQGCKNDVVAFVPRNLRPGGYFVLHDYFGWYDAQGCNGSPIKRVVDEIVAEGRYQHILFDTGYQSFVVFRKPVPGLGI